MSQISCITNDTLKSFSTQKRKKTILEQSNAIAKSIKGNVVVQEGLLDEVGVLVMLLEFVWGMHGLKKICTDSAPGFIFQLTEKGYSGCKSG